MSETLALENGELLDLTAYPLPEGVQDDVVSLRELAKGLGVSTVTVGKYIDDGMPVKKAGGNGVEYEFQLAHCFAWMLFRKDRTEQTQRSRDKNLGQLALAFLGGENEVDQPNAALTPKLMREYAEAELVRNKAAEQRRELVRYSDMVLVVEDVLVAFNAALNSLPDYAETEYNLSPAQVQKMEAFCDGVRQRARDRIADAGLRVADVVPLGADAGAQSA